MIKVRQAYQIMQRSLGDLDKITSMTECRRDYVFSTIKTDKGGNVGGYPKVDKNTGEVGTMWIIDWFDEVDAGTNKEIDISKF